MKIFTQKVYKIVKKIPLGKTMSYKEVARSAGNEKAARAVGNILHNSPSDVPCHRVVSSSRRLAANFGKGGIQKQKELLKTEGNSVEKNGIDSKSCPHSKTGKFGMTDCRFRFWPPSEY